MNEQKGKEAVRYSLHLHLPRPMLLTSGLSKEELPDAAQSGRNLRLDRDEGEGDPGWALGSGARFC